MGLVAASVVAALLWDDPAEELADTYNLELRRALRLDPEPASRVAAGALDGAESAPVAP